MILPRGVREDGLTFLVPVVEVEDLLNVGARVLVGDLLRCHSQELLEVDASGVVLVQFRQHLVDEFVLSLEAQLLECRPQLRGVDDS